MAASLLVLLFIAFAGLLYAAATLREDEAARQRVRLVFQRHNVVDCENVKIPCVTDDQCADNCRAGLTMYCQGGFCAKNYRYTGMEDCDIGRGLVVVLNALDGLAVERLCVSLYRDVIGDGGDLRPYVCGGGEMAVNLEEGPFAVEDCRCAEGYTRLSYSPGAFTRTTPVCVPEHRAALYARVYATS